MQVKRRHEAMMNARTELHRRQISQQGSEAKSDTEQKEALREAQRRLRIAEEKVAIVKRLIPIFHHAMAEYVSRSTPLADHLSGGVEKSLATLQKMVTSLEEYLAIAPPTSPGRARRRGRGTRDDLGTRRPGAAAEPAAGRRRDPREDRGRRRGGFSRRGTRARRKPSSSTSERGHDA